MTRNRFRDPVLRLCAAPEEEDQPVARDGGSAAPMQQVRCDTTLRVHPSPLHGALSPWIKHLQLVCCYDGTSVDQLPCWIDLDAFQFLPLQDDDDEQLLRCAEVAEAAAAASAATPAIARVVRPSPTL